MSKKAKRSKKSSKSQRANRGWNQTFVWKKSPKVEPTRDSIHGCVMHALKKLRRGSVTEVEQEAMRLGLAKHTKQNYRVQTQVMLRRLVDAGSATKEKGEKPSAEKPKVKVAAKLVLKSAKKSKALKRRGTEELDENFDDLDSSIDNN